MPITPGNLVQAPWRRTPSPTSRSLAIVSNHLQPSPNGSNLRYLPFISNHLQTSPNSNHLQSSTNVSNLYLVATVPVSSLCHRHHPSPTNSSETSPSEGGGIVRTGTRSQETLRAPRGPRSLISGGSHIYSRKSF